MAARARTPVVHIALLRGLNVGGANRLPMTALAAAFTDAGCTDVRTCIQSGNVLFTAPPAAADRLPALIAKSLADRHGVKTPVILRTAAELADAIEHNPFLKAGADPATLHLAFLADAPSPKHAAALDPDRSPGDAFHLRKHDLYLHFPSGLARTKLTNAYLDSTLATTSTVRTWRTVLKLHELAAAHPAPSA